MPDVDERHDVEASVARPQQELKAFTKVWLDPGESRELTLGLDERAFAFWDVAAHAWTVEPGEFELRVGTSSSFVLREIIPRLPAFMKQHPALKIELVANDRYQDLVTEGIETVAVLPLAAQSAVQYLGLLADAVA